MFGNKKETTTKDTATDAIEAFGCMPGFDVNLHSLYSIFNSFENVTENDIDRLAKLFSRLKPIADEVKNSDHAPRIIFSNDIFNELRIPRSWSKDKLDKEIYTFISGYVESDYLKNIKERGLQCRDIVEVPHVFTPFESKDKNKIHRIPKRIVSNIEIHTEVNNSPAIRHLSITNIEYINSHDLYAITKEEADLIKNMEIESVMILDDKIPSWENADIDIYKSQIYMDIIKIVTINAQEFTVKCVPEVTTMVIDRLNEAFGFYE